MVYALLNMNSHRVNKEIYKILNAYERTKIGKVVLEILKQP